MASRKAYGIVVAGVGGQGNLLASRLLAQAAASRGMRVTIAETYGVTQRGGPVYSQIRIGHEAAGALMPECGADLIIGLEPIEALRRAVEYLKPEGTVLLNTVVDLPLALKLQHRPGWSLDDIRERLLKLDVGLLVELDAAEIAAKSGGPKTLNLVMSGAACTVPGFPVGVEELIDAAGVLLPAKSREANLASLRAGYAAALSARRTEMEG